MKIKTKVNVIKEIEVDIKLPYFCKTANGCAFYKVLNEDGDYLKVATYNFSTSVEASKIPNIGIILAEDNIEIDENEFNKAFEKTVEILINK